MRNLRLYFDLLWFDLLARSQYRADFVIGILATALQHATSLATLWLVFRQVSALGGWSASQAMLLYGLFSLGLGLVNLLGGGLRWLPGMVESGELDGILVQPAGPLVQLLPRFNPGALGDLLVGVSVLVLAAGPAGVAWTPLTVIFCVLAVITGAGILMGVLTAVYSLAFWVHQPGITHGIEEMTQLGRYPAGIYPRWIQILMTWIFPVAFASYYPAAVLTGASGVPLWVGLMGVPMAAVTLAAGALAWRLGLTRYEGTGS